MNEPFIGGIVGFGGNFAPRNWATCSGQLLAISSNSALFSILGTTFGGDGRTSFALPDLRGRAPLSSGTGPGLSPRPLGQRSGVEYTNLNTLQLPNHFHTGSVAMTGTAAATITSTGNVPVSSGAGTTPDPVNNVSATVPQVSFSNVNAYAPAGNADSDGAPISVTGTGTVSLSGASGTVTINPAGSSQAVFLMQPYLVINWIIALYGLFPSRS